MSFFRKSGIERSDTGRLRRPTVYDLAAHYEPRTDFSFSRKTRDSFDELASQYTRSTYLLGRYGGRAVMQTQVHGIGVATSLEVGRLVVRPQRAGVLLKDAFEMLAKCEAQQLTSGKVDSVSVHFRHADRRRADRNEIRTAFRDVFGDDCSFLAVDLDVLALGHCTEYQSLSEYLREEGPFRSCHRHRVECVRQHLQREVGRYESYHFFTLSRCISGEQPSIQFCYTGEERDRGAEVYVAEYTDEELTFVPGAEIDTKSGIYATLEDYERASRRYGAVAVRQVDLVRRLEPPELAVIYLFCGEDRRPLLERFFRWDELLERQRQSPHINGGVRRSETFLETTVEVLLRKRFIVSDGEQFALAPGFDEFTHVHFSNLGEADRSK